MLAGKNNKAIDGEVDTKLIKIFELPHAICISLHFMPSDGIE